MSDDKARLSAGVTAQFNGCQSSSPTSKWEKHVLKGSALCYCRKKRKKLCKEQPFLKKKKKKECGGILKELSKVVHFIIITLNAKEHELDLLMSIKS